MIKSGFMIKSENRDLITTNVTLTYIDQDLNQKSYKIENALLDTGSEITLGSLKYFHNNNIPYQNLSNPLSISNALGTNMPPITHITRASVSFDNSNTTVSQVSIHLIDTALEYNVIIGINVLYNLQITIRDQPILSLAVSSKPKALLNTTNIYENNVNINHIGLSDALFDADILTRRAYTLFPGTQTIVKTKTHKPLTRDIYINSIKALRPFTQISNRYIGQRGFISFYNNSCHTITLQKNAKIACEDRKQINTILSVSQLSTFEQRLHDREFRTWIQYRDKLMKKSDITNKIKTFAASSRLEPDKVESLLLKYNSIFSRGDTDHAFSKLFLSDIEVSDEHEKRPKYIPPFKMDYETSEKVERKLVEMLAAGILEKTVSKYNSPLLAIAKKGKPDSIRIVNSFVELNKHLDPIKFPIPNLQYMLFQLGQSIGTMKAKYGPLCFLVIDFANSFWNLNLRHSKRKFTSFCHNACQYQFAKLSMGLSVAPSLYSKMLQTVMEGLQIEHAQVFNYIDDIAILLPESKAVFVLEQLLIWLQKNHFVISMQKLQLFTLRINYLGFEVTMDGIHMDPKKLIDIQSLELPRTLQQAQMLTGIVAFNAHMIPWLQYYLKPIYTDIGEAKRSKFKLSESSKRAIQKIKSLAHQDYFLHHIDSNKTIFLATDASLLGFGFALGTCTLHRDEKIISDIKIARLGSKAFTVHESLFSARARELSAIGGGLENFGKYIPRNRKIIIICDHLSLSDMSNSVKKTIQHNRLRKNLALLLEYDFEIIFLPNTDPLIELVDLASRQFSYVPHKFTFTLEDMNLHHKQLNSINFRLPLKEQHAYVDLDQIRAAQKTDDICKLILPKKSHLPDEVFLHKRQEYTIKNDLVFKVTRGPALSLFVPLTVAKQVIQYLHISAGHQGQHRILNLIARNKLFIPDKKSLVHEVTKNCLYCGFLRSKPIEQVSEKAKPILFPNQKYAVDLLDMVSYNNENVRYIMTMMDVFSRYVECMPLKSKNALEVAQQFVILCMKFNAFSCEILTDNGTEFKNQHLLSLTKQLGMQLSFISSRNARSNNVERSHRQINELLKAQTVTSEDILFHCNLAVHTYNHQANRGQNLLSPFEIRFGQSSQLGLCYPSLMQDPDPDFVPTQSGHNTDTVADVKWIEFLRKYHIKIGLEKFRHAQSVIGPILEHYPVGTLVTAFLPSMTSVPKNQRFDYLGPFTVKSRCRNTYKVQHIFSGNILIRHFRFIRKLNVSNDLAQRLKDNHIRVLENNVIEPVELPENTAVLPLHGEETEPEVSEEPVQIRPYNLRPRARR